MRAPKFSILVPTCNQANLVDKSLDSLLAQTDPDWEAVVVNDGSTDHTRDIVDSYAEKDSRVRCFHKENGGTGSALNKALEESRGEWICWLSSDDLFEPGKLALHRRWFDICPDAKLFFTYYRVLYEATGYLDKRCDLWGPLPGRRYQTLGLFRTNFINGISICVHRDVFSEVGSFDISFRYAQDYERWLWVTSRYPWILVPEWTVISRVHAGQGTKVFPEACNFDSAKAAIRFIGSHSFEQMVPLVDTENFGEALDALTAALDVASDPEALMYRLGVHPALLYNIFAWIGKVRPEQCVEGLWNRLETEANGQMHRHVGAFGAMWRAAYMTARLRPEKIRYEGITPYSVALGHYFAKRAVSPDQERAVERYIQAFLEGSVSKFVGPNLHDRAITVTIPFDAVETASSVLRQLAELLTQFGASVVLVEPGAARVGFQNGFLVLSVPDQQTLEHIGTGLQPFDVSISWEHNPGLPGIQHLRVTHQPETPGMVSVPASMNPAHPEAVSFVSHGVVADVHAPATPILIQMLSPIVKAIVRRIIEKSIRVFRSLGDMSRDRHAS